MGDDQMKKQQGPGCATDSGKRHEGRQGTGVRTGTEWQTEGDGWVALDKPPFVPFPSPLTPVYVVRRANRFVVEATDETGKKWSLHLPNSGRMQELLTPGTPGLAHFHGRAGRRTAGTLLLVRYAGRWVSVDAHMPNRLFAQALKERALPPFHPYTCWRGETAVAGVRLDFWLTAGRPAEDAGPAGTAELAEAIMHPVPDCFVETKSCNLVEDGVALFPDAPTERGTRHVDVLASLVEKGHRAAVVWFVQRDDARYLRPHRAADPAFADALVRAVAVGVEVYAYLCRVTPAGIRVLGTIPVKL